MRRSRPTGSYLLVGLAAVLIFGGLTFANYNFSRQAPGGNDFLARWTGARAWIRDGTSPYAPEVSRSAQLLIYGRPARPEEGEDIAHFAYPFPSMLFFAPFGFLPYLWARALWMTLLELALPSLAVMGIAISGWRPSRLLNISLLLFSIFWYHGLRSIIVGQFAVLEAVLLNGACLAIQRRSDTLAGILLGLSIAKPQMAFLLIPYVLLWAVRARRWPVVIGAVGTISTLSLVSILLLPDWPIQWLRQLIDYPQYTDIGSPISIVIGGFPTGGTLLTVIVTFLLLIYLFFTWGRSLSQGDRWFQWTALLTLCITNLVAIRTATTNFVVMLPALVLIFSVWAERWGKGGRIAAILTLLILMAGLWILFLSTVEGNVESAAMYLPLPFLVLIGLWWIQWWWVKPEYI